MLGVVFILLFPIFVKNSKKVKISKIKIENYKSIKSLELDFKKINIFIGGNGVGKSNLISYFKFLNHIVSNNLQNYVTKSSGADNVLHFGRKMSNHFLSEIYFKNKIRTREYVNAYDFILEPTNEDNFYFASEGIHFDKGINNWYSENMGSGHTETKIFEHRQQNKQKYGYGGVSDYLISAFNDFKIYHFHDTSDSSPIKQTSDINDNRLLKENASNISAFLFQLSKKDPSYFNQIQSTVKLIAPFFERFALEPLVLNPEKIKLEWLEKGSDKYFNAFNLSDGTLRMICLATLLLQPNPPETIIIDEPELGLHPAAIKILASLIKSVSIKTQIIISTQSVTLINQFTPEDIIIVDREDGQSVFKRVDEEELQSWQEEYSLGDIWEKNLIGGRP